MTTSTRPAIDNPYIDRDYADRLDTIKARRTALDLDEEGLAGLVPVDRILATIAGLAGGALVMAAAIVLEFHVRAIRRRNRRE